MARQWLTSSLPDVLAPAGYRFKIFAHYSSAQHLCYSWSRWEYSTSLLGFLCQTNIIYIKYLYICCYKIF